jgi:hypothetical protein
MSELLIGTHSGVFLLGATGNMRREEGPQTVAFWDTRSSEPVGHDAGGCPVAKGR